MRYSSYGAVLDSTGTLPFPLRYRWIGREYDEETGLYYLRARYYAPSIARFIQEDPGGHATTSNPYAYGEGNPTNGRDLNGLIENSYAYMTPPPTLQLEIQQDDDQLLLDNSGTWGGGALDWNADLDQQAAQDEATAAGIREQKAQTDGYPPWVRNLIQTIVTVLGFNVNGPPPPPPLDPATQQRTEQEQRADEPPPPTPGMPPLPMAAGLVLTSLVHAELNTLANVCSQVVAQMAAALQSAYASTAVLPTMMEVP